MDALAMVHHRVSRQISRRSVFEFLLHKGPISRAELAKETGLSKQTVSEIMDGFERQDWVRPVGRTSGNVGRTAVLYEIRPDSGYVVGIDLGGAKVTAAIADISTNILSEITEVTLPRGGRAVLMQLVDIARRLVASVNADFSQIRSVVVGTPGVLNPTSGGIDLAPNIPGLSEINVLDTLRQEFSCPVSIENDANVALLGEIWHGCAQRASNVAFIAHGTGIGLGLVANGRLVKGHTGSAGEIGFLPLGSDPFSPEVRSQGSLEYEVGAKGISRRYRSAGGSGSADVREIFELGNEGDEIARAVVDDTARLVALAVAAVSVLFDPKLVVLGGSIGIQPHMLRGVREHLDRCIERKVEVLPSALQNRAGVVGSVAVALNQLHETLFGLPDLPRELPLPSPRYST